MSSLKDKKLQGGVICALTTPFGADEKPDIDMFAGLIDRQIDAGIHGLFVAGTSGEGPLLLREERRLVAEGVIEAVAGRVPVIVHCGAADTRQSEHLALHAEAIGADAVAVVAPYFFHPAPNRIYDHYRSIAEAAPSIPHYLYENPERVGYSLGAELVGRLTNDVSNIVGVKDTGDSIGRLTTYLSTLDPAPEVYTGNNTLLYPALKIGALGAVSALANIVPRLFVAIYEATKRGDDGEALKLQQTAARFQGCFSGVPYIPALKFLLARAGLDTGHHRRPHAALSDAEGQKLTSAMNSCEGLREWLDDAGA